MSEFQTSLLREKFTLIDIDKPKGKKVDPVIALSNRIVVPLISSDGLDNETFIVRTQNMHSCARLAAAITREFFERGTIANRTTPLSWKTLWHDVIKGYEKDWNPDIWCAVYCKGRVVFQEGRHHPFLDIIEQCDASNKEEYAQSVSFAEKAFSKAGKDVKIEHDSNIAFIASVKKEEAKCGIIIRAATGATTFNYTAKPHEGNADSIHTHTTMTVAAAFLEGVQLAFQVGLMNKKKEYKLIESYSDEDRKHKRATSRLANLNRAISTYERNFIVSYRPDRPTFKEMVSKAEEKAVVILQPQIEEMIEAGDLQQKDWIM